MRTAIIIYLYLQSGQTALHLALRRSHIDIALLLMTKGCRLDIQDGVSQSRCGRVAAIDEDESRTTTTAQLQNGDTALHVSCKAGLLTAVQTLCHLGSPVDILNTVRLFTLHINRANCCLRLMNSRLIPPFSSRAWRRCTSPPKRATSKSSAVCAWPAAISTPKIR